MLKFILVLKSQKYVFTVISDTKMVAKRNCHKESHFPPCLFDDGKVLIFQIFNIELLFCESLSFFVVVLGLSDHEDYKQKWHLLSGMFLMSSCPSISAVKFSLNNSNMSLIARSVIDFSGNLSLFYICGIVRDVATFVRNILLESP